MIPDPERAALPNAAPRRVVVTGSECTGKTTLAADLARHFGVGSTPEYAREYAIAKPAPLEASDVEPIARGQLAREDEGRRTSAPLVIHDTDLVSTTVYATHYYGACPPWIIDAARAHRADLYLLCDIDVPWIADPQRDRPHLRAHMHALFRDALARLGAPVVGIAGSWTERFTTARTAVERLLADAPARGPH